MKPDLLLSFKIAWRARFGATAVYFCVILVAVSILAAQFSARQLATVSLDVGLSVIRLGLPVLVVLLIQELLTREFDRKLYLTSLSYPRPRYQWLLGRVLAICLMLFGLIVIMAALLSVVVSYVGGTFAQATPVSLGLPFLVTLALVFLDILVCVAMATFLAVVATTPSFVLIGTLGFLVIARSYMPVVQMLIDNQNLVTKLADPEVYTGSLNALSYVFPDLGTLDVRMLALYGKWEFLPDNFGLLVISVMIYVVALLSLAVWRLNRRVLS